MTIEPIRLGRFHDLLHPTGVHALWDTVLAETDDFIVAPTLGSIVPGWLLIVPKRPAINFAEIANSGVLMPRDYIDQAAHLLRLPKDYIWFEHGPAVEGTAVGCGIDYAHLHILTSPQFTFAEFSSQIDRAGDWATSTSLTAYADLPTGTPYYLAGHGDDAVRLVGQELGSQFFRKIIASLSNDEDRWDYRTHKFTENVLTTLDRFRAFPAAAE